MKKRLICFTLTLALIFCMIPIYANQSTTSTELSQQTLPRQTELLDRGAIGATLPTGGVYLSWRLLGSEPMDTVFNIYKNDNIIVEKLDNTNYTDLTGTENDIYTIAPVISNIIGKASSEIDLLHGNIDGKQT